MAPAVRPGASSEAVRRAMASQRRRDTRPELALRRELHRRGLRFVVQGSLPGRPDVVFTRARLAVFVDGCFWHRCPIHAVAPKSNPDWWRDKLDGNVSRDSRVDLQLGRAGWLVVRVWEHEVVGSAADRVERVWRARTGRPTRLTC